MFRTIFFDKIEFLKIFRLFEPSKLQAHLSFEF